jgi:hypothetical protein
MVRKWKGVMVKAMIGGTDLLTARPYMLVEVERPMDGKMS